MDDTWPGFYEIGRRLTGAQGIRKDLRSGWGVECWNLSWNSFDSGTTNTFLDGLIANYFFWSRVRWNVLANAETLTRFLLCLLQARTWFWFCFAMI